MFPLDKLLQWFFSLGTFKIILQKSQIYDNLYCKLCIIEEDSFSSTVVEHLPHHPKVHASSPTTVSGTGKENMVKRKIFG
jgi:hypothetical protein